MTLEARDPAAIRRRILDRLLAAYVEEPLPEPPLPPADPAASADARVLAAPRPPLRLRLAPTPRR